jgi:hypothetical protein
MQLNCHQCLTNKAKKPLYSLLSLLSFPPSFKYVPLPCVLQFDKFDRMGFTKADVVAVVGSGHSMTAFKGAVSLSAVDTQLRCGHNCTCSPPDHFHCSHFLKLMHLKLS